MQIHFGRQFIRLRRYLAIEFYSVIHHFNWCQMETECNSIGTMGAAGPPRQAANERWRCFIAVRQAPYLTFYKVPTYRIDRWIHLNDLPTGSTKHTPIAGTDCDWNWIKIMKTTAFRKQYNFIYFASFFRLFIRLENIYYLFVVFNQ